MQTLTCEVWLWVVSLITLGCLTNSWAKGQRRGECSVKQSMAEQNFSGTKTLAVWDLVNRGPPARRFVFLLLFFKWETTPKFCFQKYIPLPPALILDTFWPYSLPLWIRDRAWPIEPYHMVHYLFVWNTRSDLWKQLEHGNQADCLGTEVTASEPKNRL